MRGPCVHTHLDLIRKLSQGTHFYKKFAVFEFKMTVTVYEYYLGVCVSGEGGTTVECVFETFTLHAYKGQVQKAYS